MLRSAHSHDTAHLMLLGAFKLDVDGTSIKRVIGLNAPYGAPCFLARAWGMSVLARWRSSLNAPYGAPCFLTFGMVIADEWHRACVLMHLMVLRAF